MSERSGIPVSTLSKVEHDRLTLTYDKLLQLSQKLQHPDFGIVRRMRAGGRRRHGAPEHRQNATTRFASPRRTTIIIICAPSFGASG